MGNQAEYLGLDVCPVDVAGLGDCDEVASIEDRGNAFDIKELRGERRWVGRGEC